MSDDMIAWLRAQVDEDEKVALAVDERFREWDFDGHEAVMPSWGGNNYVAVGPWGGGIDEDYGNHIARHDPARVLREIAAKRAIVRAHGRVWLADNCKWVDFGSHVGKMPFPICLSCTPKRQFPETSWPCPTLRHLAAVYADRDGWKESWRP